MACLKHHFAFSRSARRGNHCRIPAQLGLANSGTKFCGGGTGHRFESQRRMCDWLVVYETQSPGTRGTGRGGRRYDFWILMPCNASAGGHLFDLNIGNRSGKKWKKGKIGNWLNINKRACHSRQNYHYLSDWFRRSRRRRQGLPLNSTFGLTTAMATASTSDDGLLHSSSTEKLPVEIDHGDEADQGNRLPSAFERLPDEIISQILQVSDPNVFASLTLLNPKWRRVSQQAHLYARQLSRCPSYSLSHKSSASSTISNEDLPELKRLFAKEVKQNLFDAYLRPNQTVIKIISNSISSSSAPGGEGIQFASSPKGYYLLAYNSSRIYVVNTRRTKIEVERELKILRRPAATYIDDEGSMLVVLLTDMQVDIYNLLTSPPRRTQSIILDHSPRAIAVSPCGSVLAAAYEGGIEVLSLKSTALETDRRAVKCDAVDALSFSFDGTQILGTTFHSPQPNTVILTAPYYDPGSHMEDDDKSALWTTSILFPNSSRDCSHAVLIQNGRQEEAGWTFTYDRSFETFRAVRVEDLRNGTTYFTGPSPISQAKLIPCTLPAASYNGDLVTAGFQGKDIWLYGIPDDLDAVADQPSNVETGASTGGLHRRISVPLLGRRPDHRKTQIQ